MTDLRYRRLFAAIALALHGPPSDLPEAIRTQPEPGELPSPWATRLLFALLEYRRRQLWGYELVVAHRLLGDDAIPGTMGFVPELPEWIYELNDGGCHLFHRLTGAY